PLFSMKEHLTSSASLTFFTSTMCIGYPAVSVNKRGHLGIAIAAGGRAGGGGSAVRGFVGIDDDFTSGLGNFNPFTLVAQGTHNPVMGRWGDYVTVRPHVPCDFVFVATEYAYLNRGLQPNMNARYVEFLRGRDFLCYTGWRGATREPSDKRG